MVLAADAADEHAALLRLAAGGFRDMTRISAGDPAIWPDIFRDNATAVLHVLDELLARLANAREIVATADRARLVEILERARRARRNLPARVARPESLVEARVMITDRPGALAEIVTVLGELGVNIFDLEIAHSAEGEQGVLVLAISADDGETARRSLVDLGFQISTQELT
jgi:prephenate dehydrogenase